MPCHERSSLLGLRALPLLVPIGLLSACSSGTNDASQGGVTGGSNIHHVVVVIQENHTFDNYFGAYCTAPSGSSPTCTDGPSCCEAAPVTEPSGQAPIVLDDAANAAYDPNHTQACELAEADHGKMDQFVAGAETVAGSPCSNPKNFAIAGASADPYQQLAAKYALADRYFQPVAGQSSSNDMYLAVAQYVFTDNDDKPDAAGKQCSLGGAEPTTYTGVTTIGDLLLAAGQKFAFYAEGYAAVTGGSCPPAPPDCPLKLSIYPCVFDPSDVPFQYYAQFTDNPDVMKDFGAFASDIAAGQLPEVSFVKAAGYRTEHPGYGTTVSAGATFVQSLVDTVFGSAYANDTLILVTWDEGGGYFDHVTPPPLSQFDGQPYGTRVPLLAIGPFAKQGTVSHTEMEHSSIVKFIEYNFLHDTGQLQARDLLVANIGSMLDPERTGIVIPND